MAKVKLGEFEVTLNGDLPSVGSQLPDFLLADGDLQNVSLEQFKGKKSEYWKPRIWSKRNF